mmetsp:Transcript_9634/g.13248  ORF Transcript_9634/g.13248 Transcript_9634/m.13248 type:complete len:81 (-) Transcript_9634:819-1061(-)
MNSKVTSNIIINGKLLHQQVRKFQQDTYNHSFPHYQGNNIQMDKPDKNHSSKSFQRGRNYPDSHLLRENLMGHMQSVLLG